MRVTGAAFPIPFGVFARHCEGVNCNLTTRGRAAIFWEGAPEAVGNNRRYLSHYARHR